MTGSGFLVPCLVGVLWVAAAGCTAPSDDRIGVMVLNSTLQARLVKVSLLPGPNSAAPDTAPVAAVGLEARPGETGPVYVRVAPGTYSIVAQAPSLSGDLLRGSFEGARYSDIVGDSGQARVVKVYLYESEITVALCKNCVAPGPRAA